MAKIIAAFNMTLDGNCDHTAGVPDADVHNHYTDLLNTSGAILYGRTTYGLMEYWRPFLEKPSGEKAMDNFAHAINRIPKIVFSHTLKTIDWDSAELSDKPLEEKVEELRQQQGSDVLVGSRSLILQLTNLGLIDEYQLCIHPVLAGKGLPLFENINGRIALKPVKTKTFTGGAVILYYERAAM